MLARLESLTKTSDVIQRLNNMSDKALQITGG